MLKEKKSFIPKFKTLDELKSFEIIDDKVSEKYIPIYSSEIITHLSPEFRFTEGYKHGSTNSAHTIVLQHNDTKISFQNSYDRSCAFRFNLMTDYVRIPLNIDRQVHLGKVASALTENIRLNKNELIEGIGHAKTIVEKLKNTPIQQYMVKDIEDIIFNLIKKKEGFTSLTLVNTTNSKTLYGYINFIIDSKLKHNYTYTCVVNGVKKVFPTKETTQSAFAQIQLSNKINRYLFKNFPEIMV